MIKIIERKKYIFQIREEIRIINNGGGGREVLDKKKKCLMTAIAACWHQFFFFFWVAEAECRHCRTRNMLNPSQ